MKSYLSIALISLCASAHAQKTTVIKKRIIASANYSNTVMVDSNRHYYSTGSRGSFHTDENSYYDLFLNSSIDAQNIFCDSTVHYEVFPGMGLIRFSGKAYQYNSSNLAQKVLYKDIQNYRKHTDITYNTTGKITVVNSKDTLGNGTPASAYIRSLSYNSIGKLSVDSNYDVQNASPVSKKIYKYDANGNDTVCDMYMYNSGIWEHTSIIRQSFDSRNRLVSRLSLYFVLGSFINTQLDSFGYRGTDTFFNSHITYSWDNNLSIWLPTEKKDIIFSNNKLTDTLIFQQGQMLDTFHRKIRYYDSPGGLITAIKVYRYQGAGDYEFIPTTENYFYFQTYDPASVTSVIKENSIVVSPNPSKGLVNINGGDARFNHIIISDMQGRNVYTKLIPVANTVALNTQLPADNYVLSLYNEDVHIASQKLVIE